MNTMPIMQMNTMTIMPMNHGTGLVMSRVLAEAWASSKRQSLSVAFILCGGSAEANSDRPRRQADEPRILHPSLPVLDRFAVDGVADHGDEGGDSRVLGDEAEVPALLRWTDQHLL